MGLHLLDVVDFRRVLSVARAEEVDARRDELCGVLVGRGAVHVEPFRRRLDGESSHHVVSLEAVHAQHWQAEGFSELEGVWDVGGEVFGHLLALRLVGRVRLVAEGGARGIHRQHGVRGLVFGENRCDAVREAE